MGFFRFYAQAEVDFLLGLTDFYSLFIYLFL